MITPRNILQHELVGLQAMVSGSSHGGHVGMSGKIVDETRQTLTILHKDGSAVLPKHVAVLHVWLPTGEIVKVQGKMLVGRPEDRIKTRMGRRR